MESTSLQFTIASAAINFASNPILTISTMSARKIALLIETSKAFGRGILAGVSRYARVRARWTMYVEERGLDDGVPAWLSPQHFDGIIVRSLRPETINGVLDFQIPTVCLGEENPPGVFGVINDDAACARLAADHLLQREFRHFGYVGLKGFVWSDARREHFAGHLRRAGYPCDVLESSVATSRAAPWYQRRDQLSRWIRSLPKPVGVMTCYDTTARTLLDVCRDLGILVPEQVAIIGVDNDEVLCELSDPPLTSVAPNTDAIGAAAARLLDQLIDGQPPPHQDVVVPPKGIVTRQSTDTQAIDDPAIATALGCIRRGACDGMDVSDLLDRVPLSRRTLERRFKNLLGHSPLEEIRRVRLGRVKELLRETDLKLEAIAKLAGYSYTAYMVAQFRESEGITPGQFRREKR